MAGGPALAGTFAGSLILPFDAAALVLVAPGTPLFPFLAPSPGTLGLVGYFSLLGPGGAGLLPIGPMFVDLINLPTITAGSLGMSTLSIMGSPPGSELGFATAPLFPTLASGTITVTSAVPDPATRIAARRGIDRHARWPLSQSERRSVRTLTKLSCCRRKIYEHIGPNIIDRPWAIE